jgi:dTMP kinase
MTRRGILITFEGVEGCGKTTQLALLRDHLESKGYAVEVTREPGGTPIAEAVRAIVLDPANKALSSTAEMLLYAAARAQHVDERVRPALEAGRVVLSDRFVDSTTAYQGAGRGSPMEAIRTLHEWVTRGVWPDLTVVLDVDPETGLRRAAAHRRLDRIEAETLAFHRRVREGFLRIAEAEPARVRLVDGTQSIDLVAKQVREAVDGFMAGR